MSSIHVSKHCQSGIRATECAGATQLSCVVCCTLIFSCSLGTCEGQLPCVIVTIPQPWLCISFAWISFFNRNRLYFILQKGSQRHQTESNKVLQTSPDSAMTHAQGAGMNLRGPIRSIWAYPTLVIFVEGLGIGTARSLIEADVEVGSLNLPLRQDVRMYYRVSTATLLASGFSADCS